MASSPSNNSSSNNNNHNSDSDVSAATRRAARGTATTVLLRLLSFAGTQWCVRRLNAQILGQAAVHFELVLSTILYVSREGFRLALTRPQASLEAGWWSVPVATATAAAALLWHWRWTGAAAADDSDGDDYITDDYRAAGALYCLAAALEGWAEPAVLHFLHVRQSVAEKASAEGLASVVKTVTTVALLSSSSGTTAAATHNNIITTTIQPATALGLAQCAYAAAYFLVLYGTLWTTTTTTARRRQQQSNKSEFSTGRILPRSLQSTLDYDTLRLVVWFTLQGLLKFALQEGDRIVLNLLADSYNQGVYAIGSAYGGLAARLLLQPMEENARLLFGRMAVTLSTTTTSSSSTSSTANNDDTTIQKKLDPHLELSFTILVKAVLYVGLIFSCLATNYTGILLHILAGHHWGSNAEAVNVLSAFCLYTAFLAGNGLTEAFVYGVAQTAGDVRQVGIAHTVTGLWFAIAAPMAVRRYGTVGLVLANCSAMLGRTLFAVHFAARYLKERGAFSSTSIMSVWMRLLRRMLPSQMVLISFVAAYLGTQASRDRMTEQVKMLDISPGSLLWFRLAGEHIVIGATFGVGILSLAYMVEREFRANIQTLWHGKQD